MFKVWEKNLTGLMGCPKKRSTLQRKLFKIAKLSTAVTRFVLDMLGEHRKAIHLKYYGFSIDNASKKVSKCRKTSI